MRNKIYIPLLCIVIIGCVNKQNNKSNAEKSICFAQWEINTSAQELSIVRNNINVLKQSVCEDCHLLKLVDTLRQSIFISYGEYIYLIDCVGDTLHKFELLKTSIPKIKPMVDSVKGRLIYSNLKEFYLFDRELNSIYSSWDFIETLSDTIQLGLSGVIIDYEKSNNMIILFYKFYTDFDPVYLGSVNDTIMIQ